MKIDKLAWEEAAKLVGVELGGGKGVTAKEYLTQLKNLDNMINAKLLEQERLQALAEKVTMAVSEKVQVGSSGSTEDTVIKIMELKEEINRDIDRLSDLRNEVRGFINKLENEKYKSILSMYYVSNMTFEKIAENLHYSIGAVFSAHRRAVAEFEKIMHQFKK